MNLIWDQQAKVEFIEAVDYYGRIDPDLGESFSSTLEAALLRVCATPKLHRKFDGPARKARVERFPYAIIYRIKGADIYIIAIMHLHRDPGYWRKR